MAKRTSLVAIVGFKAMLIAGVEKSSQPQSLRIPKSLRCSPKTNLGCGKMPSFFPSVRSQIKFLTFRTEGSSSSLSRAFCNCVVLSLSLSRSLSLSVSLSLCLSVSVSLSLSLSFSDCTWKPSGSRFRPAHWKSSHGFVISTTDVSLSGLHLSNAIRWGQEHAAWCSNQRPNSTSAIGGFASPNCFATRNHFPNSSDPPHC